MPQPGPAAARDLVGTVVEVTSPPRTAVEVLGLISLAQGWASSAMEAAELAEKWEARFLNVLREELSDCVKSGRPSAFDFNSSDPSQIQGSCFAEPADSDDLKTAKALRSTFSDYAASLAAVVPTDFEAVCRGVLAELGVPSPSITPRTADEGIDFYGRLKLADLSGDNPTMPRFVDTLDVWLVGQAKHYPFGQVATPEIRELVGAVNLAKAHAFSRKESAYADLTIRACDPVFFLFFTTGSISSFGKRLLDSSGVVGMDGLTLAAFLADNGVALVDGEFNGDALNSWISGF